MKNSRKIPGLFILLLLSALLSSGCTLIPGGTPAPATLPPTPAPVTTVTETAAPAACGFTTCHGLELACGPDAPQVCTMEYRLGDKCRQYAECDSSAGSCTLVTGSQFSKCKSCVEQCQIAAGPDNLAAFSCEEKC